MLVPCTVESVRVHVLTGQHVVLLQARESNRLLPIWIGADQAHSIATRIVGIASERPLTHDLMMDVLSKLGAESTRIVVRDVVSDEERDPGRNIRHLRVYLSDRFTLPTVITIADNVSRDGTLAVARRLAEELPGVRVMHLDAKGRGRALRSAWTQSDAQVVTYMDVDLSTDLAALLPLVAPLVAGESDVGIGSRLARGAQTRRGVKREFKIGRAHV